MIKDAPILVANGEIYLGSIVGLSQGDRIPGFMDLLYS